jgi:hypothetical protein
MLTGCAALPPAEVTRRIDSAVPSPLSAPLCRLGFAPIPMTALPSGHHMVRVNVNGRMGSFLVDTGAGLTIVHAPYVKAFGLSATADGRPARTLTGIVQVTPMDVARFAIGGTDTQLSRIYAMDLSHLVKAIGATTRQPIQGLIGQDVMRDQKAIIDVEHSVLYLKTVHALEPDRIPCGDDAPRPQTAVAHAGHIETSRAPRMGSW